MILRLDEIRQQLEFLISVTATGPIRNHLTEANIILMVAEEEVKKNVQRKLAAYDQFVGGIMETDKLYKAASKRLRDAAKGPK